MKIKFLSVVAGLMFIFLLSVSAAGYEYSISVGENFTEAKSGDDLTKISRKIGMSTDELNSYFSKNGLLYLAVSDDSKTQIRLSAFTDNYSSEVNDISHLNDEQLSDFMNSVSNDGENVCKTLVNNGRKYITVESTHKDSGGVYTVTQYITICSGQTFYLSCYNDGESTSAEIQSAFNTFSLNGTSTEKGNGFGLTDAAIIAGILIFTATAVIMVAGIIKSVRNKDASNDD